MFYFFYLIDIITTTVVLYDKIVSLNLNSPFLIFVIIMTNIKLATIISVLMLFRKVFPTMKISKQQQQTSGSAWGRCTAWRTLPSRGRGWWWAPTGRTFPASCCTTTCSKHNLIFFHSWYLAQDCQITQQTNLLDVHFHSHAKKICSKIIIIMFFKYAIQANSFP